MEKFVLQISQNALLSPIFDGFCTGQRFVFSEMNFCNALCPFAGEAIFSNDELGSQSGSFYQLWSTFSNKEQRKNQSVIYYRCSGIIHCHRPEAFYQILTCLI